jgi:regulator of sirC expression with transglutaminase-like and TPR domain
MDLKINIPSALDYFKTLVQSDDDFPLLEAAVAIAQDEYPEIDIQQTLDQVDQMIARLKRRLSVDMGGLQKLMILNQFFFTELGFSGNINDYYDPDNSFIHLLLKTRRGIPISLAVLWLELAQGIGLKAHGASFPGHFLVTVHLTGSQSGQVVLDPFTGESLSKDELVERLQSIQTPANPMPADQTDAWLAHYLQPASPRRIIERMLRNLIEIYTAENDSKRKLAIETRLQLTTTE